ncbi:MAG: 50S ribosomal protein L23 [Bdellovibrionota bacterium]
MRLDEIIKSSVLSEKAYTLAEKNVYVLKVALKANKHQIKEAVTTVFGVEVIDVNTSITRGKIVRKARSKKSGAVEVKLPNVKKAFVKLKEGQKLPVLASHGAEQEAAAK